MSSKIPALGSRGPMNSASSSDHDLVGGPFAVLESDPGVFTTLLHRLGAKGLEVEEILSIDSDDLVQLNPRALILCYHYHENAKVGRYLRDPTAEKLWFAHQLNQDACATITLLNILLNCWDIKLGDELDNFKAETENFDSVMKGLAVSNMPFLRKVHNSLARFIYKQFKGSVTEAVMLTTRPCDIRGSIQSLSLGERKGKKPAVRGKRRAKWSSPSKRRKTAPSDDLVPTYHYIGYIHHGGHVWEMDGLGQAPVDVGEIEESETWLDVVRPALKARMGMDMDGAEEDILFNLMAVVDGKYSLASDKLALCQREKTALEQRLSESHDSHWQDEISEEVMTLSATAFSSPHQSETIFSSSFASQNMHRKMQILSCTDIKHLKQQWVACVHRAEEARHALELEMERVKEIALQNAKRAWDYEPFIREYVAKLQEEGMLEQLLNKEPDD